ncbi:Cytochrome P450 [Mycena indigotica]|uniref:Cytochrome P450 n=1 Tax=Mycena indigotica TaxID=2126181 RepID=A0A8H6S0F6_9AGAR|nr:Cytochrome P450 [Mycena indigotica]KAF7289950.1 Cytochrome P450 [Mycena indigotica]
MQPTEDYNTLKVAFVSGMKGSSILHVNLISLVALASIALYCTVHSRIYGAKNIPFLISWTLLTLPLLLSMTVFATKPILLCIFLLAPAGLIFARSPRRSTGSVLPDSVAGSTRRKKPNSITPVPALTTYRAHMMLMTVLGILAVDFPVFPRALAKCESYGVSLMDLGVGSFVFSNGVVSAIPLLKSPQHLQSPLLPKLGYILRKSVPIIALGGIRVLLVKGTDYPEHETEYGTHWSFFMTLALLPVLQVFLHPLIRVIPVSMLATGVGLVHQLTLSRLGLKEYVRSAPRVDLISANKEGIVSLAGYLSIYLYGLSLGTIVLPPTPKFFPRLLRQRVTPADLTAARQNGKTVIELTSYAIVWWTALGILRFMQIDEGVSRQMANFQYVLWITAFNTSFILAYLLLDITFYPPSSAPKKRPNSESNHFSPEMTVNVISATAPPLLDALNKNGLPVFLLARECWDRNYKSFNADDSRGPVVVHDSAFGLLVCNLWRGVGAEEEQVVVAIYLVFGMRSRISMSSVVQGLGFSLFCCLLALLLKGRRSALPFPPGPSGHGWRGLAIPKQHPYRKFEEWLKEHGPVISFQRGFGQRTVVIGRYQAAVEIMEKEGIHLADRPTSIAAGDTLSGGMRTLLIPQGDRLRKLRKALHAQLRPVVAAKYQPIQQHNAQHHVLDILRDPQNHLIHAQGYATSVILSLTYGKSSRTSSDDPIIQEVSAAQSRLGAALLPGAYLVDEWPMLRYVPGYLSELRRQHQLELKLFTSQLDTVRNRMASDIQSCFAKTILEKQADYGLSYNEVAYLAGSMFGAGSGTSSSAISIVIMAAATHPEAQAAVHKELDAVITPGKCPTFQDEADLVQVTAFYLESYRWRPVSAGGFAHRATQDIIWNGLLIPRGASVYGSHWSIARDPEIFPDPERFDPRRWLTDDGSAVRNDLRVFQFGFGRRVCPGSHVANRSLFINTALLLWAFRISEDEKQPIDTMAFTNTANMHPLPFAVCFEPRRNVAKMTELLSQTP